VGEFVPPRKLLKKVGDIEMWQVETLGPRGRNMTLVQLGTRVCRLRPEFGSVVANASLASRSCVAPNPPRCPQSRHSG
jgi:hypothetical protein